ncbi:MAG: DNA-3-methyladenine glycosylase family protein [Acidimicrobiales bacterium]
MAASDGDGVSRSLTIDPRLDLATTVRGAKNPVLVGPTEAYWCTRTPEGTGALSLQRTADDRVEATAWGAGAGWLLDQVPRLLGADDDPGGFAPSGRIGQLWRRSPFRLARTDRPWDALVGAILGQKVQTANAAQSRRALARRFGDPAPGPRPAWILPSPDRVAGLGYHDLHPLRVERKRAEVLIRTAREMPRLAPVFADGDPARITERLAHVRGIGPWTAAMVTAVTVGDPDAVPVGDFHLPNTVAWLLAGEPRADDARMLELLEPYAGHRWRVLRLAKSSTTAPRYGPRLSRRGDGLYLGR